MKLMEIGVSQRETYQLCQRKWAISQLMGSKGWGLIPARASVAQDFGTIGHVGLQTWYANLMRRISPEDAVKPAKLAMDEFRRDLIKRWNVELGISADETASAEAELSIVDSFIDGYSKFYREDSLWEIVDIEKNFSIPGWDYYPKEAIDKYVPLGFDLPNVRGTVDLIVRTDRGLIVIDHKFHKFIDTDLQEIMSFWKQPKVYCRAVELIYGEPVVGYIHNQIRKPNGLKPRLDKKTGTYESAEEFAQRLANEYLDFPSYFEEYPDRKKGYFARSDLIEVDTADQRFLPEMLCLDVEMKIRAENVVSPTAEPPPMIARSSPKNACNKFGETCPYMDLCKFGHSPATIGLFVERLEPHP